MSAGPEPALTGDERSSFSRHEQKETYQRLAELALKAMGSRACALVFVHPEEGKLVLAASAGFGPGEMERNIGRSFSLGPSGSGHIFDLEIAKAGSVIERFGLQNDGQGVFDPAVARKYDIDSLFAFPIDSSRGVLGYFCHFASGHKPFSKEQKRLVANQTMLAMEILEKYQDLDPVLEMSEMLSQGLLLAPPGEFLPQIATRACELLSVPICVVWLLDERRQRLNVVATAGDVDEEFKSLSLDLTDERLKQHLEGGRVAFLANVNIPHPTFAHREKAIKRGWRSLLTAPMTVGKRPVGMLDIYTKRPRRFRRWEKLLFRVFANHAALSILRTELFAASAPAERGVEDTLSFITDRCAAVTGADVCTLQLFEAGNATPGATAHFVRPGLPAEACQSMQRASLDLLERVKATGHALTQEEPPAICVPFKSGAETMGVLCVIGNNNRPFAAEQRQVLESILDAAPGAIARASLRDSLLRIARTVTESDSLDRFLKDLVNATRDLMRQPICHLWLLDRDRNCFSLRQWAFLDRHDPANEEFVLPNDHPYAKAPVSDPPRALVAYSDPADFGCKSALVMPLVVNGRMAGIMQVGSSNAGAQFTPWRCNLFETLGAQAMLAIGNINRSVALTELNQALQQMANFSTEAELLEYTLGVALKLVGTSRGWISRYQLATGTLEIVVESGEPARRPPLKIGQGVTGHALQDEKPVLVSDVTSVEWKQQYEFFWPDTRSELAVPILIENADVRVGDQIRKAIKPLAVLNIESPTVAAFSEFDRDCLWSLARCAATILERIEYDLKLQRLRQTETVILANRDWDAVIENLLDAITETLGYERVNLSLISADLKRIQTAYVRGVPQEEVEEFKKMAIHPLAASGEFVDIQADIANSRRIEVPEKFDRRYDQKIFERFNHQEWIRVFMPMIRDADNKVIGSVEAGYRRDFRKHIYERDVQVLKGFVDYATAALEQKTRGLLDVVGHQVKMPIVGIRSNASFLRHNFRDLKFEEVIVKLEDILTDTEILRQQAAQLDFLLGGSVPRSRPRWTNLMKDVVVKTLNQLRPLVRDKGFPAYEISYSFSDIHRVRVFVDKTKASEVVYNLVMNAIKYAVRSESFELKIEVEEDDRHYAVKFLDWGVGVSEGLEERIFEEGFRAPEARRLEVSGSGLGLSISRAHCRDMGGDLLLKNRAKPTEFQMILPKQAPRRVQ